MREVELGLGFGEDRLDLWVLGEVRVDIRLDLRKVKVVALQGCDRGEHARTRLR